MKIYYRKLEINDLGKIYELGCKIINNNFISELSSQHFIAGDHKTYRPFLVEHDWMGISVFRQIP